jgi:MoxR-like ATPase
LEIKQLKGLQAMKEIDTPFRDQPIPPHASMVVEAVRAQPNIEKITLSGLANTLKAMGLKDAYRKVQELPRKSTCRIDGEQIIEVYAQLENVSASTEEAVTHKKQVSGSQLERTTASVASKDISATYNPSQKRKILKTSSYRSLEAILKGKKRLNIFVDGDSGIGKSMSIIDIWKKQGAEIVRFNCSFATDVDDLLGGYRLVDGETVYFDGPVIIAQERGACLLLDEIDACDPKILFEIQSVLEGNGVLLKKVGRMSYPKEGFQCVATGNTKGRGDLTGDFAGTSILNKSFLDRFDASITWERPTVAEMKRILRDNSDLPESVTEALGNWYGQILEAVENGVVTSALGTRRMQSIADMCENFGVEKATDAKLKKAVDFGTNQFDEEVILPSNRRRRGIRARQ